MAKSLRKRLIEIRDELERACDYYYSLKRPKKTHRRAKEYIDACIEEIDEYLECEAAIKSHIAGDRPPVCAKCGDYTEEIGEHDPFPPETGD